MNINFEIANQVWWRPSYYPYTNEQIAELIRQRIAQIQERPASESDRHDFFSWYQSEYLMECLVAEKNIRSGNLALIQRKLFVDLTGVDVDLSDAEMRETMKIVNVHEAIEEIFPRIAFKKAPINDFNEELAKKIHRSIGSHDLIMNAGEYRTNEAKPAQETSAYLEASHISKEIAALFSAVRDLWETHQDSVENTVKVAALFLSSFLYIHPFSNGNGRVARLLASYLLSHISFVPVMLTDKSKREVYVDCLRESRWDPIGSTRPGALAALLLERILAANELYYITIVAD